MSLKIIFLLMLYVSVSFSQAPGKKNPRFNPLDYPKNDFQVSESTHQIGDVRVQIIHVRRRKQSATPPSFCRAWVEITRGERLLHRIYYDDFEPVGSKFGVFVPNRQPSPAYFLFVKEGDYDGHLGLVDTSGYLTDTMGGPFFLADGRFLVSQYSSDEAGLAVFDLQDHKLLFKTTNMPYIQKWYKDRKGYFFTESEWLGNSCESHEKPGVAYRLDLRYAKLVKVDTDTSALQSAVAVKYDFDPRQFPDCTSQ